MNNEFIKRVDRKYNQCVLCIWFCYLIVLYGCSDSKSLPAGGKIIVEAVIHPDVYHDLQEICQAKSKIDIHYTLMKNQIPDRQIQTLSEEVTNKRIRWIIYSDDPVEIFPPLGTSIILNPGDSIFINYRYAAPVYTGSNKHVLELLNKLMSIDAALARPIYKNKYLGITLNEVIEWNHYLDTGLALKIPIVESYREKITENEYLSYKLRIVNKAELLKLDNFSVLSSDVLHGRLDSTNVNLNDIWDSTQCSFWREWLLSLTNYNGFIDDIDSYNKWKVMRRFGFDTRKDSFNSDGKRAYLYYVNAKQNYKGELKEKLIVYILDQRVIPGLELDSSVNQFILKDYYSQPGFLEYKIWIKEKESSRKLYLVKNKQERDRKRKELEEHKKKKRIKDV